MKSEEISFSHLNNRFAGTLYTPAPHTAVVAVHPASEPESTSPFFDHLKSELPRQGIAVLLFDRRGSGASEGDFETAGFEDLAGDVISAVEYLQARQGIDRNKVGLHGTSQGAWIAPIAAARKSDIAFIVAVSASGVSPADQMDYGVAIHLEKDGYDQSVIKTAVALRDLVNEYFRGRVSKEEAAAQLGLFEHEPWYEQAYLYRSDELPFDITHSKWHYEMDYEPMAVWKRVTQPVLFLFAGIDEWVPVEQSMLNYESATGHLRDVKVRQIKGADHLMHDQAGEISREYLNILVNWLTRF